MNKDCLFFVFILSVILCFLAIFFLIPSILVLYTSVKVIRETNVHLVYKIIAHVLTTADFFYIKIYCHSFIISLSTLFFTVILGCPFAYFVYCIKNKFLQQIFLISIIIPFWTSSLIRTYSIIFLLRTNGVVNKLLLMFGIITEPLDLLYNFTSIIIGFTYTLIPFIIIPVYLSLIKIKGNIIEAAKDLGANDLQVFTLILLPLSYSAIISGGSVVFLASTSMFYLSDILGGSKYNLISNLIKNKFLVSYNWNTACFISLIFYIFVIFSFFLQKKTLELELE